MPAGVLVLGATRILRPAVLSLVSEGNTVLAVARSAKDLDELAREQDGIVAVPADWSDPARFAAALVGRRIHRAVLYCPGAPNGTLKAIASAVSGAVVQVLTSSAAAPDAKPPTSRPRWRHLQLGWTGTPSRWHTPDEISAAALDVLRSGEDAVLGRVRPWDERPA